MNKCYQCARAGSDNGLYKLNLKQLKLGILVCSPEHAHYKSTKAFSDACPFFKQADDRTIQIKEDFYRKNLSCSLEFLNAH